MENYSYNSSYPESGHSSPRSRDIEFENTPSWEDAQGTQPPQNYKVKFMCSYGGKVQPRPHDNQLSYVGGETKILAVDRSIKFGALLSKLIALCDLDAISFKYQLPGEDLDALISVTNDDDLEHVMHEYDRLYRISPKPARLRIFVFPSQSPSLNSSVQSFGSDEGRMDKERFVEALNIAPNLIANQAPVPPAAIPPVSNVDLMFGFEKSNAVAAVPPARVHEFEDEKLIGSDPIQKHIHDLQRLRIEEQQEFYGRKGDENFTGGATGGEYNRIPEKLTQTHITVPSGNPYWTERQVPGGVFPASNIGNEQQVYMIPTAQPSAYHAPPPIVRPVNGAPPQGYYAVQMNSPEVYRDQQQQVYNMIPQQAMTSMTAAIPTLPPQKVVGYSEGYGMVRRTETGYAQMAYDSGAGRQVVYSAPGGVMGQPAPYQGIAAAMSADGRPAVEAGGKSAVRAPQSPV